MNVKQEIEPLLDGFDWNFIGVISNNGDISPIPRTSNPVTAIMEEQAISIIRDEGYDFERPNHTRQYPDLTLHEDGQRIALDIKTAQKENDRLLSGGITLGSSESYFKKPDEDSPWCKYPYGSYDEHWVLAILYKWNPDNRAEHLITDVETVVNEKWKIAGKSSGSGTTHNIGSSTVIEKIRGDSASFDSEEEFEQYWRNR